MRILVRAPNWIGDQIIAFPFFYFLRRCFPQAHIVVTGLPWVESLQFLGFVDEVIVPPKNFESGWLGKYRWLKAWAKLLTERHRYDLAFCLPPSFSSAFLLKLSGARTRVGYGGEARGFLLTKTIPREMGEGCHRAVAYLRLLSGFAPDLGDIEEGLSGFWPREPENDLDPPEPGVLPKFDLGRHWPSAEFLEPPGEPYFVVAPGSQAETRRWPIERFYSLARALAKERGLTVVLVGGLKEMDLGQIFERDPDFKVVNLIAQGDVASLGRIFQQAKFTLSNDSGLAHVAALCGSPVHLVWGAGDPKRTRPLGPGKISYSIHTVDCWPCEKNVCFQKEDRFLGCLRGVTPEKVREDLPYARKL